MKTVLQLSLSYARHDAELRSSLVISHFIPELLVQQLSCAKNVRFDRSQGEFEQFGDFLVFFFFYVPKDDYLSVSGRKGGNGVVEEFLPLAGDQVAIGLVARIRNFERIVAVLGLDRFVD